MDWLLAITECIFGPSAESEVEKSYGSFTPPRSAEAIADEVIQIIKSSEKRGVALQSRIKDTVDTQGWTQNIAEAILNKLKQIIQQGQKDMGPVLREAIDSTTVIAEKVFEFAKDHPNATAVFCTIVALGVLVLIAPWIIEALGFGELGPIEGESLDPLDSEENFQWLTTSS